MFLQSFLLIVPKLISELSLTNEDPLSYHVSIDSKNNQTINILEASTSASLENEPDTSFLLQTEETTPSASSAIDNTAQQLLIE